MPIIRHVHENEGPRSLQEYHQHHRRPYQYRHNRTSPLYRSFPSHSSSPSSDSPIQNASESPNKNASDSLPPLSKKNQVPIFAGVIIGGAVFLVISSIGIYLCKTNKLAIVRPWSTGISGQLQKALVTGKSDHLFSSKLFIYSNNS